MFFYWHCFSFQMFAQVHDMSVSLLGYSSCASFEGSIFGIEAIKRCWVNVTISIYLPSKILFQMCVKVNFRDMLFFLFFFVSVFTNLFLLFFLWDCYEMTQWPVGSAPVLSMALALLSTPTAPCCPLLPGSLLTTGFTAL